MLENNLAVTVKHENWYMMCLGRYGASLEAELLDEVSDDVSERRYAPIFSAEKYKKLEDLSI
jgi:hypothetical protein